MVTTRMSDAVPMTMPSAVRMKRALLLQKVSKAKARISPKAIFGLGRSGIRAAAIFTLDYVAGSKGASKCRRTGNDGRPGVASPHGHFDKLMFGCGKVEAHLYRTSDRNQHERNFFSQAQVVGFFVAVDPDRWRLAGAGIPSLCGGCGDLFAGRREDP